MKQSERRLRDTAKDLRTLADAPEELRQRIRASRAAGIRHDLDVVPRIGTRRTGWAAIVIPLLVGSYFALQIGNETTPGEDCMIDPQLRPLINVGLVVASACATDIGQAPSNAPVSGAANVDAELFSQAWRYVSTNIRDGVRSAAPTVHELQFHVDETSNAWMAITTVRSGSSIWRVDTTMIDPADLSPLRSRRYGEINDRWQLITESQWQNEGLVVATSAWPDGEQNSVEVSVPDGPPMITGFAHVALRLQQMRLDSSWTGAFSSPSIRGTHFMVLNFAVVGETDMVGPDSTRVPVWMVSVGLNEQAQLYYLVAKHSGRLMGYRTPVHLERGEEVALAGWTVDTPD